MTELAEVDHEELHPSSPLLLGHNSIPFPEVLRFGFNCIICFFFCFDLDKAYTESLSGPHRALRRFMHRTWRLGPVRLPCAC